MCPCPLSPELDIETRRRESVYTVTHTQNYEPIDPELKVNPDVLDEGVITVSNPEKC